MVEEDAFQSNPVDQVQLGRGYHPVEVVGGGAGRISRGLKKEKEEEGKTR